MKRILFLLCVLLPSAVMAAGDFDRWFVLQMQGQRAGHAHMSQATEGERITTETAMRLAMRRGAIAVEIEQAQAFVETPAGEPIEATSVTRMGTMAVENRYRWTDAGIEVETRQGGQVQRRTLPPIEGEWLTPAAAQRYAEAKLDEGAETITLRTVDLSMGVQPVEATMRVLGEENVEVFGKTVPAVAWEATLASMPGIRMREYVDDEGRTLKTTVQVMPGMEIEMLAADEALAKLPADPPEVMAALMIEPTGEPLEAPRELTRAVYDVKLKDGVAIETLRLPTTGYQRVEATGERTARVTVDVEAVVDAAGDAPTGEHLAASTVLNHEDERIRALVAEALPANVRHTPESMAEALRRFVHGYLDQKSLAVGFATASEVARTREGDCSEHAVLLAAMLRAAGVPSRTATGLVFIDEFIGRERVFGGHMWTQAWLDTGDGGRWVDLDATLPDEAPRGFDAAHVTLGVATLDDEGMANELVEMAPLVSGLAIDVVEAGVPATP